MTRGRVDPAYRAAVLIIRWFIAWAWPWVL